MRWKSAPLPPSVVWIVRIALATSEPSGISARSKRISACVLPPRAEPSTLTSAASPFASLGRSSCRYVSAAGANVSVACAGGGSSSSAAGAGCPEPAASVVAAAGDDRADSLPAASSAATSYRYVVSAARPRSVWAAPPTTATGEPSR